MDALYGASDRLSIVAGVFGSVSTGLHCCDNTLIDAVFIPAGTANPFKSYLIEILHVWWRCGGIYILIVGCMLQIA